MCGEVGPLLVSPRVLALELVAERLAFVVVERVAAHCAVGELALEQDVEQSLA
jgi:hypothetical protein